MGRPVGGETITELERRDVVVLAERPELTITWSRYAPGERGPELHVHREHADAFYVLEGELTFAVGPGPERVRVPAGGFVAVPAGVVHAFSNEGSADARWLNLHAPEKGFADYLRAARDGANYVFDSFDPPADGGLPATEVVVTGAGEGEGLALADGRGIVKGVLADLCVAEWVLDGPADGPELPGADGQVVAYYVLEGEFELTVGGSGRTAAPDALFTVPRGVPHAFAHRGAGRARFLSAHAPDGGFAASARTASSVR